MSIDPDSVPQIPGPSPCSTAVVVPLVSNIQSAFPGATAYSGNGQERMIIFFSRMFDRLTPLEIASLSRWLRRTSLQLGTVCSGTDCPVLVCQAMRVALLRRGLTLHFEHCYSCELNPEKRAFLQRHFRDLQHLYCDIDDIAALHWTPAPVQAPDAQQQGNKPTPVPDHNMLVGGFPCTDVSTLHCASGTQEHRQCVLNGSLRTGGVFDAIIRLILHHQLDYGLLENVAALAIKDDSGVSNCDVVLERLSVERDCFAMVFQLTPWIFGGIVQ